MEYFIYRSTNPVGATITTFVEEEATSNGPTIEYPIEGPPAIEWKDALLVWNKESISRGDNAQTILRYAEQERHGFKKILPVSPDTSDHGQG